mmetsp:Transcript_590/g.989  ORF Transcript_590/g.989 Transcript_590/m.989 type:complete len:526 (+) Transcript_590:966-2543(+)
MSFLGSWFGASGGSEKRRRQAEHPANIPGLLKFRVLDDKVAPKTVVELSMMRLSANIRETADWEKLMHDPSILSKWRKVALKLSLPTNAFDYTLDELRWHVSQCRSSKEPSTVDGCWLSRSSVDETLRRELVECVTLLETDDNSLTDWRPGSDSQIRDLVDPSLHCLVSGVSRQVLSPLLSLDNCLASLGAGTPIVLSQDKLFSIGWRRARTGRTRNNGSPYSSDHQWIPSEFKVAADGSVSIGSYINNLHPIKHARLYSAIARVFEMFVPLFDRVLMDLLNPEPNRVQHPSKYIKRDPAKPKPLQWNARGKQLQVIVKLANIVLTPDNPRFKGGSWHSEGLANERIVASGIYYYSCDNITETRLSFRQAVTPPPEQERRAYGFDFGDELIQEVGNVLIHQNLLLCFPNALEHRVEPFEVLDKSRPGHRNTLVFFLIDPTLPIISSASVPPQQSSWYAEEIVRLNALPGLPRELVHHIVGLAGWPMSVSTAKMHRDEMREERRSMGPSTETYHRFEEARHSMRLD